MSENAVMMARAKMPEVFQDDGFLPDLELDIITTRPEYAEDRKDKLVQRIRKCDIWKVLPTFLVSNAFSISISVLTTCSFVKLSMSYEIDPISFGLWSYTDPDRLPNGTIFNPQLPTHLPNQECHPFDFSLHHRTNVPEDNMGVTLDSKFRTARAFGILTACIGFLTMAALWMGVIRDYNSTTNWRRWVGGSLLLCSFFQGMTLVVLKSGVCDFGDCHLGGGASWVIVACVLWFSSGLLLLKWPRAKEYTHSTLAGEESEDGEYEYPAEVGEQDDASVLSGLWKAMGSEQIEMVKPYRDNPETGGNCRPAAPAQSSSLRDLLSGFDSELNVSFEPAPVTKPNRSSNPKPIPPPSPPPSSKPLQAQNVLQQLRHQSTIKATESPPKSVAPPVVKPYRDNPETGGNCRPAAPAQSSSLRDLLSSFDSELNVSFEPAPVTKPNRSSNPKPIPPPAPPPSSKPLPAQNVLQQLRHQSTIKAIESPPKSVAPPPVEKVDPPDQKSNTKERAVDLAQMDSREELKKILDAFDDDSL